MLAIRKSMFAFTIKRPVVLAFFYLLILVGCDERAQSSPAAKPELVLRGRTMGTSYTIKLIGDGERMSSKTPESYKNDIDALLQNINQQMSTYIDDSQLSIFNKSAVNTWFDVDQALCHVLSLAESISKRSEGRFDITVGPFVNLWGFGPVERQGAPSEKDIETHKKRVGFQLLKLDCPALRIQKERALYVDLSAIAKGYAVDRIGAYLLAQDVKHFMVEIGGELLLQGVNAHTKPWRIAIEKPAVGRTGAVQVLSVSGKAVATSGDYRNYKELDGERVSHTIDPITGRPIAHSLASVTVIGRTCAEADAWATALNVLGLEEGMRIANEQRLAAYFIDRDGGEFRIHYTPAFKPYLVEETP